MSLVDLLDGFPARDYVVIGGLPNPGRARISGASSPRDWDIRKQYGVSGATAVFTGRKLSRFTIEFDLWQVEHFALWVPFQKMLDASTPKAAIPSVRLGIDHPLLALLEITEVVVEDIGQFDQSDTGLWTCPVKFLQWRPPLPALARPAVKIPAVATPTPTAQDAEEVKMNALVAQINTLGGGL